MTVVSRLDTSRLDEITAALKPRASVIIRTVGFEIQAQAQVLAPVDTGALRAGIMFESTGDLSGNVHDSVEYGIFQELGTSKLAAQPFMTPAVEIIRPSFVSRWAELFE